MLGPRSRLPAAANLRRNSVAVAPIGGAAGSRGTRRSLDHRRSGRRHGIPGPAKSLDALAGHVTGSLVLDERVQRPTRSGQHLGATGGLSGPQRRTHTLDRRGPGRPGHHRPVLQTLRRTGRMPRAVSGKQVHRQPLAIDQNRTQRRRSHPQHPTRDRLRRTRPTPRSGSTRTTPRRQQHSGSSAEQTEPEPRTRHDDLPNGPTGSDLP